MKYILQTIFSLTLVLILCSMASAQENLNQTDKQGQKQGQWIKKYPNGQVMYEAFFIDGEPVGEFKRYDEEGNLTSVLNYSADSDTVSASFYHPNGYIAAKGQYIGRKKSGKWFFYSDYVENHLLMKCNYEDDKIEGTRIKYHWNGEIAEILEFSEGVKSGTWKQYFNDGTLALESTYKNGKRNGEFKTWHTNGKPEIKGRYVDNVRTGEWNIYNSDGTLRREIKYNKGIPENRAELIREETEYLDKLEKEGGKIEDPEITGIIK